MNPEQSNTPVQQSTFPLPPVQIDQKPKYSVIDTAYAWLCFLFAFLFCQSVPVTDYPLGGFLLILALFIAAFVILTLKKIRLQPQCILTAISAILIATALLLTETGFLVRLAYAYSLASHCFLIYAALGNRVEQGFSDYIYIDFVKILFILPFASLAALFPAIANESTKKGSRFALRVLIGIGIAIIPTALVFAFLSYDDGFMKILDDIFSFDSGEVFHFICSLIFTTPLAMYGFGLYASSGKGLLADRMTAENCRNGLKKTKILPQLTAIVAVIPIVFLYVVFFISQWQYYISGFTGVLPEDFSYAEYARQGFFELCSVSVINLIIIIAIGFFIKRSEENKSVILKIITLLFCLFTLILISTAVAKLVMYIDFYGLTEKRIYAMWLMALIAIVFLVIALGQFISKIKMVAVSVCVFVVMFTGLSLCNVNALTARYNTNRYLTGSLETLDIEWMEELGDSAIPSLAKVVTKPDAPKDEKLKITIDLILHKKAVEIQEDGFSIFSFSIPSALAKAALSDYVPAIPPADTYYISSVSADGNMDSYEDDYSDDYLVIHTDRTGTFYYNGKPSSVTLAGDTMTIKDSTFTFSYYPATEDREAKLNLYWTEDDESISIYMRTAKPSEVTT